VNHQAELNFSRRLHGITLGLRGILADRSGCFQPDGLCCGVLNELIRQHLKANFRSAPDATYSALAGVGQDAILAHGDITGSFAVEQGVSWYPILLLRANAQSLKEVRLGDL
jgi:hypothetical protein